MLEKSNKICIQLKIGLKCFQIILSKNVAYINLYE